MVGAGGKADRDRDQRRAGVGVHAACDLAADAFAERQRGRARQLHRDHHEFLAAVTEDGVIAADRLHHDARDAQQHHVAGGVPETVIEALEVVWWPALAGT